jgi:two-component system response regulator MtrA
LPYRRNIREVLNVPHSALVVEDDPAARERLTNALQRAGFDMSAVATGREALARVRDEPFDLIVVSLVLPDMGGLDLCRNVRVLRQDTIIILVGESETAEVVIGLELGADDYLKEPFDPRELVARARAALRRAPGITESLIRLGRLTIDIGAHRALKDGNDLRLSVTEFRLLLELARRADNLVSREDLVRDVWRTKYLGKSRSLDMAIKRLRDKIEDDPHNPRLIRTVHGLGYRFDSRALLHSN